MKRVITEITVSEVKSDKFYLAIKDDVNRYSSINFLRFEPIKGWIFRNCREMEKGHSGYYSTHAEAIQNIVKGWTVYQFDSLIEAIQYINSLNLVRSS